MAFQRVRLPITYRESDPSGPAVPNRNFVPFDDHGHLSNALRMPEHLIEFQTVRLHVVIFRRLVDRPGLIGVRSAGLSVNNDFLRHNNTSKYCKVMPAGCRCSPAGPRWCKVCSGTRQNRPCTIKSIARTFALHFPGPDRFFQKLL